MKNKLKSLLAGATLTVGGVIGVYGDTFDTTNGGVYP